MRRDRVRELQKLYPQIYLACHTRHQRASTTTHRISANDAALLSHLDEEDTMSPRTLAGHLGVAPSTLSATTDRLARLGYVIRRRSDEDRRRVELLLSPKGAEAMRASSVLEASRVNRLLRRLTPQEQDAAIRGLSLLARAARELTSRERQGRRRGAWRDEA